MLCRLLSLIVLSLITVTTARGQLRIADYNTANGDASRQNPRPGMDLVLDAINDEMFNGIARPIDILVLQEQNTVQTTTQQFVNLMNQVTGTTNYARGNVNGTTTGAGRMGVVYNTQTVQLIDEQAFTFLGAERGTLRYQFRPVGYDSSADFYVYTDHYKAGTATSDQTQRTQQSAALRVNSDALGQGASILYTGDFNITSSAQTMYQNLLAAGNGQAFDPISTPGNWKDTNALRHVHTQSPTTSTAGGLVNGGMDDRFDFQLATGEVVDGEGLSYIGPGIGDISVGAHSYHAFGNNGTHILNGDINTPSNTAQPIAVLNALNTVSDHIPVVADYQLPARMNVSLAAVAPRVIQDAVASLDVTVSNTAPVAVAIGADELDFAIIGSGAVTGSAGGVDAALGGSELRTLNLQTTLPGMASGSVAVTSSSQSVADGSFSQPIAYDVLAHSEGSFASTANSDVLAIDLGYWFQNTGDHTANFDLFNLDSVSGFTADLDLDGISGAGDIARLLTDFTPGSIAAGASRMLQATLDTTALGTFNATWTFDVSDEDLLGATTGADLVLSLTGQVLLLGDFDFDLMLDADDIDLMFGSVDGVDLFYDLTGDMSVTSADVDFLVRTVFGTEYGDANLDHQVSGADFTIWADNFQMSPGGWAQGDFTGDLLATGADFTLWADHFGFMGAPVYVPEPGTWVLAAVAVVSAAAGTRFRRRTRSAS